MNNRRAVLTRLLAGGSLGRLAVPARWITPAVVTLAVPAHAAASPATTTTSTTTSTTTTSTTPAPTSTPDTTVPIHLPS